MDQEKTDLPRIPTDPPTASTERAVLAFHLALASSDDLSEAGRVRYHHAMAVYFSEEAAVAHLYHDAVGEEIYWSRVEWHFAVSRLYFWRGACKPWDLPSSDSPCPRDGLGSPDDAANEPGGF